MFRHAMSRRYHFARRVSRSRDGSRGHVHACLQTSKVRLGNQLRRPHGVECRPLMVGILRRGVGYAKHDWISMWDLAGLNDAFKSALKVGLAGGTARRRPPDGYLDRRTLYNESHAWQRPVSFVRHQRSARASEPVSFRFEKRHMTSCSSSAFRWSWRGVHPAFGEGLNLSVAAKDTVGFRRYPRRNRRTSGRRHVIIPHTAVPSSRTRVGDDLNVRRSYRVARARAQSISGRWMIAFRPSNNKWRQSPPGARDQWKT